MHGANGNHDKDYERVGQRRVSLKGKARKEKDQTCQREIDRQRKEGRQRREHEQEREKAQQNKRTSSMAVKSVNLNIRRPHSRV